MKLVGNKQLMFFKDRITYHDSDIKKFCKVFSETVVRTKKSFRKKLFRCVCAIKKALRFFLLKLTVWLEMGFKVKSRIDGSVGS